MMSLALVAITSRADVKAHAHRRFAGEDVAEISGRHDEGRGLAQLPPWR